MIKIGLIPMTFFFQKGNSSRLTRFKFFFWQVQGWKEDRFECFMYIMRIFIYVTAQDTLILSDTLDFHCSKSETHYLKKKVLVALQSFYEKSCSQDRSTASSMNLCLLSVMKNLCSVVPAMVHVGLSCPCQISKPSIKADTVKLESPAIFCTIPGVVKYISAWTIQVKQVLPLKS